jgi:hypothetical protein
MYSSRFEDALAAFREQNRILGGRSPHAAAMIGVAQAFSGNTEDAERALAEVREASKRQPISSSLVALLCLSLGERDEGFEWLERAYEERDLVLRQVLPVLKRSDMLGDDPRFHDLLDRMGLQN